MSFQYTPLDYNRSTGTIGDLMLRAGEAQANAKRQSGLIKGQGIQQVGEAAAGTIGSILQGRQDKQQHEVIAQVLHAAANPDGTYDLPKVQQAIAQVLPDHLQPLTDFVSKTNAAITGQQTAAANQAHVQAETAATQATTAKTNAEVAGTLPETPAQKSAREAQARTQEETARHNTETERISGLTAGRAEAAQQETVRHNRAMEARPAGGGATGSGVAMSPDAVDYSATQIRLTNNMAVLNRLNDNDRKAVLNRVAEQTKTLGQTPAAAIQKQFAMKADGAALTQVTKLKSSAEAFENKATAQIGLIKDLSAKVGRTQWPLVNGAILAGKTSLAGDENASKLVNAVVTFSAEYAKIMEGSTGSAAGSSDSARRASEKLVSAAMNQKTLPAVLDQMAWEMRQTGVGYDATLEHITERMGGATPPASASPAPASAPAGVPSYQDYLKAKGGQ